MIATLGTTDAFGVDDLRSMVMLRDELVQNSHCPIVPTFMRMRLLGGL